MFSNKNEGFEERNLGSSSSINLIGESTRIKGDINSTGDIRIDGHVKGSIKSKAKLVIGPKGTVEGDIVANNADISGTVTGSLTVKGLLFLKTSAKLEGDIISAKLVVEAGASFNGTCRMGVTKEIIHEGEAPTQLKKNLV